MLILRIRIGNLDLIWRIPKVIWIESVAMPILDCLPYLMVMAENKLQSIVQKRSLLS